MRDAGKRRENVPVCCEWLEGGKLRMEGDGVLRGGQIVAPLD